MRKIVAAIIMIAMATVVGAKDFVVVIDAGHGGNDPGAVGNKVLEKDVNLGVALALGKAIDDNFDDVKVVYTRTTDVFVTLQGRPAIANKANGDLFISIHTNACESKAAFGTETFTLGLAKTNANFDVAKRENSVMLLENDKEVYKGFDPTSPDSYIMFEVMQSTYVDQSIMMADLVEKEFTSMKRYDRGVRQAGFWVLHQVKMPSILIEVGFVTNPTEETYIGNKDNQKALANGIYRAFAKYKHEYDKRMKKEEAAKKEEVKKEEVKKEEPAKKEVNKEEPVKKEEPAKTKEPAKTEGTIYSVQCFAIGNKLDDNDQHVKNIKKFGTYKCAKDGKYYKYYCGNCKTYEEAKALLKQVQTIYKDAFLVMFTDEGRKTVK